MVTEGEMRVLVLSEDRWHSMATVRAGLAPLAAAGFAFDWVQPGDVPSPEQLAAYPLVVLSKSNNRSATDLFPWADDSLADEIVRRVRAGQGWVVIHSGVAGYGDMPTLRGMMGGAFIQHPPQCPVTVTPDAAHPLCAGSAPFTLTDEHYHVALDDAGADVFLTTTSEHGAQPAGWTRREGDGRVCVLTPGHNVEVWLHPAYQRLIDNALRWASGL
ncbi:MAG: ThuA domain-containing protein [Anaerolineae bacterium]